ncbi:hypothetical protein D3C87_1732180 [compost metagenome]
MVAVIVRYADDFQPFVFILAVQRQQMRVAFTARYTPAGPEIQQNIFFTFKIGQAQRLPVNVC